MRALNEFFIKGELCICIEYIDSDNYQLLRRILKRIKVKTCMLINNIARIMNSEFFMYHTV